MNGITIGDEAHEDEMGPQDGDDLRLANSQNRLL